MVSEAEYYRSILDNLTGGLVSVDLEGTIVYINPTAGRILRLSKTGGLVGMKCGEALGDFPTLCEVINDALQTHKTVHRAEISILHGDVPMIIGYSTLQIKNPKSEYLGIAIVFQDLTFVSRKNN